MTRLYGRAWRGRRVRDTVPGGHWKMLTVLGAMDHTGMLGAMTVEAATDTEVFLAFLDHVLCPRLRPGHVVVMDNLSAHKVPGVRERIEARGARLLYLPPYSPDLNPIEKAWAKLKQGLRRLAARTLDSLQQAITDLLPTLSSHDASAWLRLRFGDTPIGKMLLEPVHDLRSRSTRKARRTMWRLELSVRSQFFQSLRHFSSQANDRSTIHLCGMTAKVWSSLRFAICTVAPRLC